MEIEIVPYTQKNKAFFTDLNVLWVEKYFVMVEFCLLEAKRLNMTKIILYSNTILESAIHLYKKLGFEEIPLENSLYTRSDIKMEINL